MGSIAANSTNEMMLSPFLLSVLAFCRIQMNDNLNSDRAFIEEEDCDWP